MTMSLKNNNLTRSKLRQLITSARKHVPQEQTFDDVTEYNWHEPHHFNLDELAVLDSFGKKIESRIVETFVSLCQSEFNVTITSITQHFACALAGAVPSEQQQHYFLPVTSTDGKRCGYIGIPPETAAVFVGQMLREAEVNTGEDKKLSQLEESILMDITSSIVESIDIVFKEHDGPSIQRSSSFVRGDWPLEFDGLEDLYSMNITADHPDGTVEFSCTLLANILDSVLGAKSRSTSEHSSEEIRSMIMQDMDEAPIEVIAQLCSALIPLSDLMSLSVGDVLLLDKKINEPIDILLNKTPCLRAYPAASQGKYAIVIAPKED